MAKSEKMYGINDLAKSLGIQPATVRKNLRDANIKKKGASYEWGKGEFDATVKKLSSASAPAPATKKTSKPQAKGKGKKAA